jgi:hypothetical protein
MLMTLETNLLEMIYGGGKHVCARAAVDIIQQICITTIDHQSIPMRLCASDLCD